MGIKKSERYMITDPSMKRTIIDIYDIPRIYGSVDLEKTKIEIRGSKIHIKPKIKTHGIGIKLEYPAKRFKEWLSCILYEEFKGYPYNEFQRITELPAIEMIRLYRESLNYPGNKVLEIIDKGGVIDARIIPKGLVIPDYTDEVPNLLSRIPLEKERINVENLKLEISEEESDIDFEPPFDQK